jgi:hypothetical protein
MRPTVLAFLAAVILAGSGLAQQGPPPEKFQPTDIFITAYKGPSVADPAAFHNSQPAKDFESELQSDDDERFCLQAPQLVRATGFWNGAVEPSYWIHANARPTEAEAYASEHAQKHGQDSVLVFETAANGPDAEYVFSWSQQPQVGVVLDAVKKAGFDGASIAGNKLLIVDVKGTNKSNAATLAETLGATLTTNRGRAQSLKGGEMEKALRVYDAFPHSCPWHQ